jgi:hypothetical protein
VMVSASPTAAASAVRLILFPIVDPRHPPPQKWLASNVDPTHSR